jgi:hypothetical protein
MEALKIHGTLYSGCLFVLFLVWIRLIMGEGGIRQTTMQVKFRDDSKKVL